MALPVFNREQPGCVYYYTPLSVYCLGAVDEAHKYDSTTFKAHLHAHVWHQGVAKKGASNVASLVMKTLGHREILKEGEIGGELCCIFNNCTGQNKNNTMLKLKVYLTEMKYFKRVKFIFLIKGHTKNAADRLFNLLKWYYRMDNAFTMAQLIQLLDKTNQATIHEAKEDDMKDWESFLDLFYSDFSGKIKKNHIFECSYDENRVGSQLQVNLRESNLNIHPVTKHNAIKRNFLGRNDFSKG